jgi:hypothetical protein
MTGAKLLARLAATALAMMTGHQMANAGQKQSSRHAQARDHFAIKLEIAAGAAGDESLSRGVYLFRVWGDEVFMELQRITLNQCSASPNQEMSFSPTVDSWNTTAPLKLDAVKLSDTQIQLTAYQAFEHQLPAKMTLTFDSRGAPFTKLVGLQTTGFIDGRYFPAELKVIDYVPIEADRLKTLDCPVLLHGLHSLAPVK